MKKVLTLILSIFKILFIAFFLTIVFVYLLGRGMKYMQELRPDLYKRIFETSLETEVKKTKLGKVGLVYGFCRDAETLEKLIYDEQPMNVINQLDDPESKEEDLDIVVYFSPIDKKEVICNIKKHDFHELTKEAYLKTKSVIKKVESQKDKIIPGLKTITGNCFWTYEKTVDGQRRQARMDFQFFEAPARVVHSYTKDGKDFVMLNLASSLEGSYQVGQSVVCPVSGQSPVYLEQVSEKTWKEYKTRNQTKEGR